MEFDFKSEYLFCTYFVATDLVTSLDFDPIRCANMLFHLGRTRNGSVAILFILVGSTATISATGGYVSVPERFGQNKEPASFRSKKVIK